MIEFLLVVAGTVFVCICVGFGQGGNKRVLLVLGAFAAWVVLPSVFLQAHWGYYREYGGEMGDEFDKAFHAAEYDVEKAAPLAMEVCPGIDVRDPTLYYAVMTEQQPPPHFFYYSKYSAIIWVGLGSKDRYCLVRYLVTQRRHGELSWIPSQLFPYPFFRWYSGAHTLERRLIDRLPPAPQGPDGIRALSPGECAKGEVPKGGIHRFQVEVPEFGQTVGLQLDLECARGEDYSRLVEWTKDGRSVWGEPPHRSKGGGLYQIAVRASATENMAYSVGLNWGWGGCGGAPEASYGCEHVRNADGSVVPVIRPKDWKGED